MIFRNQSPAIVLGEEPGLFGMRSIMLLLPEVERHIHLIGLSGMGKSVYLAHLYAELTRAGYGVTLIDPHGDLAEMVAALTGAQYIDIRAGYDAGRYMGLDVLQHDADPHVVADNVREAFHRAWPALAGGVAPRFDKLVLNGVKLLVSGGEKLPALERLLLDPVFRGVLLKHEPDENVVRFWQWFDRLPERLRVEYADSALSRINLLTFSPVMKHSLGGELLLNPREIMDEGRSLAINMDVPGEAGRLLGSLLVVMYEQAALRRRNNRRPHFLLIDEFSEFSTRSEEAFSRILSQCRKFGLYLVLAHQTWSQASSRLKGALQNVGIEIAFRLGRTDAQDEALILGRVDPEAVKHEVDVGGDRSHPLFYTLPEQWERHVQRLQELPPRTFLARYDSAAKPGQIRELSSPSIIPAALSDQERKSALNGRYFFKPASSPVTTPVTAAISRRQPL